MAQRSLPGSGEAAVRLRETALRDFSPPASAHEYHDWFKRQVRPGEIALPLVARYALELIGMPCFGPAEKVAWWVDFSFRGREATFACQKFGLRVWVRPHEGEEAAASAIADAIVKKLTSSIRTVEQLVLIPAGNELLASGAATVVNRHHALRAAYEYFRDRATNPVVIDVGSIFADREDLEDLVDMLPFGHHFPQIQLGPGVAMMNQNSLYDLVAAVNAYLSLLEHDMVLALAFVGFDPTGQLTLQEFIGLRWGDKYSRILDLRRADDKRFYDRLVGVVERWRNTHSHGGFEKGHGRSVWLHYDGIGAVPVGLTSTTQRTSIFFPPATESHVQNVFKLFDEIDAWLAERRLPEAFQWIQAGLEVRLDVAFREDIAEAMADSAAFTRFVEYHQHLADRALDMDY